MEDLHTFLVNFNPFKAAQSIDDLAMRSVKLMRDLPPERMARRCRAQFVHCCTVEAQLVDDTWWVPEQPPQRSRLIELRKSMQPLAQVRLIRVLVGPAVVLSAGAAMWLLGSSGSNSPFNAGM